MDEYNDRDRVFRTDADAINQYVSPSLGEAHDCFDNRAIFEAAFRYDPDKQGFRLFVDTATYWQIVARYEIPRPGFQP